jgi:uncharacterized protein (DUF1697 family)
MTMHVALLRAVNLPGHNKVAMADLRAMFEDLGFATARTLLQSGNVVFEGDGRPTDRLETVLETAAEGRLRLGTDFFVRTADDWASLIAANPFPEEARRDPSHLLVHCLKQAPGDGDVKALQDAIKGRETVRAVGRQAYIVYPDGIGRSRLSSAMIEKHLRTPGTGRNWNTVLKLAALAER